MPVQPLAHASLPADFEHGEAFAARLVTALGRENAGQILARLAAPRRFTTFWVNPLLKEAAAVEAVLAASAAQPVAACPGLFQSPHRQQVTHSAAAHSGAIYIQSASSYLAAQALGVQPDEEVLDLAAAPGGKTIALAAQMANTGRIAAVEPVKARFHRLRANVERCGVANVAFYQRDGRGVGRAVPERFDRVLLDAPCSSEARINFADASTYRHWEPRKVRDMERKQRGLIRAAYDALKPGGTLLYCTCSFAVEENEAIVARLLKRTDAQLLDLPLWPGSMPGVTEHASRALPSELCRTRRILPGDLFDGFFVARLTKPI